MFRGRYEHTIDGKGRTSLPARYREVLSASKGSRLVVTTALLDPCLLAYPLEEWEAFEARLAKLPTFDRSVMQLRRLVVSGAVECDLDKLGRVLLPAPLREHASLTREVVWAGVGPHIELWAKDAFDAQHQAAVASEESRMEMAARLSELGL